MVDPEQLQTKDIFELRCLAGMYSFRLNEISEIVIKVKVWLNADAYGGDRYIYTVSHSVHTPVQFGPYSTSNPFATTEQAAVKKAIADIKGFLACAASEGHAPSASWLVPNEGF